jgi:hypothetical protein
VIPFSLYTPNKSKRKVLQEHSVELHLHLQRDLPDVPLRPVVKDTVIEHQVHVGLKLKLVLVSIAAQLALNGPEVHGVLHDGGVVVQVESRKVNRLVKVITIYIAGKVLYNFMKYERILVASRS